MGENIISFNFTNWITVVIMALGAFAIVGALAAFARRGGEHVE